MKYFLSLLALLSGNLLHANVKLPAVFSDHLVLQRDKPVAVWGTADAGEAVTVTFGGQSKQTTAAADGSWKVALDPLKARAEPAELKVKGRNEVVFKDILVGEVWVCSGQSNMEWPVSKALNADEEAVTANHPKIRLFSVPKITGEVPLKDIAKSPAWQVCSPETVKGFSAVGYFFGRELHKALDVPVGLINTSWGGTPAEAWTSREALANLPTIATILKTWDQPEKTEPASATGTENANGTPSATTNENGGQINSGDDPSAGPPPPVPATAQKVAKKRAWPPGRPAVLFNGMVAPLIPFTAKGVIWYQGESNQTRAVQYQTLLPTLIADWRRQWGDDLSFHIVQLAGYGNNRKWPQPVGAADTWAELQWAQLQTSLTIKKSGIAVINDIGAERNIHPGNKQEVGHRLALLALVKDYQKLDYQPNGISGGPLFGGAAVSGNKVVVSWSNVGGGLVARDGGELKGFIIAGEDKVWKPAKAQVVGQQVHVSSDEVTHPVAVRYAWAAWCPEANLINKEGFPASLFRTDNWELSTEGLESPSAGLPKSARKPAKTKAPENLPKADL